MTVTGPAARLLPTARLRTHRVTRRLPEALALPPASDEAGPWRREAAPLPGRSLRGPGPGPVPLGGPVLGAYSRPLERACQTECHADSDSE